MSTYSQYSTVQTVEREKEYEVRSFMGGDCIPYSNQD